MAYQPKIKRDLSNLEEAAEEARQRWDPGRAMRSFNVNGPIVGFLYRVYDQQYSTCSFPSHGGEEYGVTNPVLEIEAKPIKKWTKCGATLHERVRLRYQGNESKRHKFVNLDADKQYASRTPMEALDQYRRRKLRQQNILEGQLAHVARCIELTYAPSGAFPELA